MAAKTEYKISEPTRLALDAIKAAEQLAQAVSDFYASNLSGEEADAHTNSFLEKYYSPMYDFLEEELMGSIRFNRALTENKGEVI